MIRYVPKDIAKDVQKFVEKDCKETGVHIDEKTGRVALATTSQKDIAKIAKKFADKGLVF